MRVTNTREAGLEALIFSALTGFPAREADNIGVREEAVYGGGGYVPGRPEDYDRDHALDTVKLFEFLNATQPKVIEQLDIAEDGPKRLQFLNRLQGEIARHGVVHVLRHGFSHGPASGIRLYFYLPSPGNEEAARQFAQNIFSVTRQLRYSKDERRLALDLALFVNGLPVATFELKNRLTKQTVADAVTQYQRDRDPRELLFQFGRCMVHFAVDDQDVRFCTHLQGKSSWFLPFNKGYNDGAGNPPNPGGFKTDYLWKEVLEHRSLANILENYAQIVEEKDELGRKKRKQIFPRYHQLRAVRRLLADAGEHGVGRKYLIQHSAGSGKSNTIAWLAYQLVELRQKTASGALSTTPVFDSIIVINDRTVLDKQIKETIKGFHHVGSLVGHSEDSAALRKFIAEGKKIIITTLQKFPVVLDELGVSHRNRTYAIIIDEAHSSQGGRTAAQMNMALSHVETDENESSDEIIARIIKQRRMIENASYFGFTATPKGRTLELFGTQIKIGDEIKRVAFDTYTMKQAIQEGFIMDVLQNYTPVESYWRLAKAIEEDPAFDKTKALKRMRHYAERHELAIRKKAEIMVEHFLEQVVGGRKIGGQARGMVVCNGIERAYEYFKAISAYLTELKSPYKAIVAFSGEHEFDGRKVTEATLNGFPSSKIERSFKTDPYRLLVVADKYLTGFDEPLLHTMYVDKPLAGIKAVQTLSRLNRAHPQKHDTFVLDFANSTDVIVEAFQDYFRSTVLAKETDPDKLHDLKADLDARQIYTWEQVETLAARYVGGAERDQLDPILDACVAVYIDSLDEEGQVKFKGNAKKFCRSYGFLSSILPYGHLAWEKLSIFLNFLIPKLPAPEEEDLSKGVLEAIDMDSYRPEVRATISLALKDENAELAPPEAGGGGGRPEPEMERLSNILKTFNEQFGNIEWKDSDKIRRVIEVELPQKVAEDKAYQNAIRNSDKQNARVEHDKALQRVILEMLSDHTELFKQFSDNPGFKRWLADSVFDLTYRPTKPAAIGLGREWLDQARGVIVRAFGPNAKWQGIAEAVWQHFKLQLDDPLMLSDIQRISGELGVEIDDVTTVLQVLAAAEPPLLSTTFTKVDPETGEDKEVALGVVRQSLANLSTRGILGEQAEEMANQVLLGWRPAISQESANG
ncbi:type I restriction endonuclease subunit R [Methylocaldum gracile]|jgi:type I restriction enzyme R subunit|uniref:type I restriction endonuclease subunit R n=1 Tax=Methylocaldum sp. 0917 TaxID=2485163 RepID=UPI00105CA578